MKTKAISYDQYREVINARNRKYRQRNTELINLRNQRFTLLKKVKLHNSGTKLQTTEDLASIQSAVEEIRKREIELSNITFCDGVEDQRTTIEMEKPKRNKYNTYDEVLTAMKQSNKRRTKNKCHHHVFRRSLHRRKWYLKKKLDAHYSGVKIQKINDVESYEAELKEVTKTLIETKTYHIVSKTAKCKIEEDQTDQPDQPDQPDQTKCEDTDVKAEEV